MYKELEPIQKKRAELEKNPIHVSQVLQDGAKRARAIAEQTVKEVRGKMGLTG
jgi:tryptophanyl-tRNA synthetase